MDRESKTVLFIWMISSLTLLSITISILTMCHCIDPKEGFYFFISVFIVLISNSLSAIHIFSVSAEAEDYLKKELIFTMLSSITLIVLDMVVFFSVIY